MEAPDQFIVSLADVPIYRISNHHEPFWSIANMDSGRFHEAASGPTQYWSLHPLGPFPELIRSIERALKRSLSAQDSEFLESKYHYWVATLSSAEVFNLTFDSASVVGLSSSDVVKDDQRASRQAGEQFGRLDPDFPKVWRYPSAALPGTFNLVIFGARALAQYDVVQVSTVDVPGSLGAAAAKPPLELPGLMRHIGMSHASLEAWENNEAFTFDQPTDFALR